MSRRKCCCCNTESNCKPIRDVGKVRCDTIKVVVSDDFIDNSGCTGTPKLCETTVPGTFSVPDSGAGPPTCSGIDDWLLEIFDLPNCRCEGDTAFMSIHVFQECVGILCVVTIELSVADCTDTTEGSNQWIYKAIGPIDIEDSKEFRVPFFGSDHGGPRPCVDGNFPDELIIKEV